MLAIRPPMLLPPIVRFSRPSASITAPQVSKSTGPRSGGRLLPSACVFWMYGNSNHATRMPAAPNCSATWFINAETMPTPVPWAKARVFRLDAGPPK